MQQKSSHLFRWLILISLITAFVIPTSSFAQSTVYLPIINNSGSDSTNAQASSQAEEDMAEAVTFPVGAPSIASEAEALALEQTDDDTEEAEALALEQTDDDTDMNAPDASKGKVTVTSVRTADTNGNTKTVFTVGDPIRYYGYVKNTTGNVATAYFVWSRKGPCGSATLWAGYLDTGIGTWLWNLDSTAPTDCQGSYKYTLSVTYNGKKSSKSTNFSVRGSGCPTIRNWKGEYWNNPYLNGNPILCRDDADINFDWGTGSPSGSIPNDGFSARWTRASSFSSALYRFHLRGDDGVRLWVDNTLLIDQWHDQVPTEYTADWNLNAGNHNLRVEYYENGGGATVSLWWEVIACPRKSQGDADCDGRITLVDYEIWRREYFNEVNTKNADFNNDGIVDLVDYAIWQAHYPS